jgi:glycosyltransferase involved in cell wall biosynthesis
MRRVLGLTAGQTIPSARFRVGQFAGRLGSWGVDLIHRPSRVGAYPPRSQWRRPLWLASTIADRVPDVIATYRHDVTLLQREFVSTIKTIEGLTKAPRVLDVDDAIWMHERGGTARRIALCCDRVICGNSFLAEYFGRFTDTVVLPTAVDTQKFFPLVGTRDETEVIIGWSGSSGGFPYLDAIDPALAQVVKERPNVRIRLMADRPRTFVGVPPDKVDFLRWTPEAEADGVRTMHIGIMPLAGTEWERGKCSFKMIQYLACGIPAVVSPVGMNNEVLAASPVGLAATTTADWRSQLIALVDDAAARAEFGAAGRALVERHYSWSVVAPQLAAALR